MQRRTSSASAGSWQASIQFYTQPGTAWRRHIAAIAAYTLVAPLSPHPRCFHHGKEASTLESGQGLSAN
jgi:hypothetical protein